ncbi:MAG: PcfJ domain-containing protein [Hyphomicrobiaceae bacterium]|nr:PcfJ domain-containing protein [Hyphomicrobiaceae bacterium]
MALACEKERREKTEKILQRFDRHYQRRLRKLAGLSPRLAELLASYPAAAFAIVSQSAPPDRCGRAVRLVRDGAGLKDVADALTLPRWTRRLMPQAFSEPIGALPRGPRFAAEIGNYVPVLTVGAASWLQFVQAANRTCGEDLALWAARERHAAGEPSRMLPILPLAAYAWFSRHGCGEGMRPAVATPFDPDMGFARAVFEARLFVEAILDRFQPHSKRKGPGRYSRRPLGGMRIVRLSTQAQLYEEGQKMRHCVGTYFGAVARGECLIFSVRDGIERIATLELRRRYVTKGPLSLVQLQGPGNTRVAPPVRDFVSHWLMHEAVRQIAEGCAIEEDLVFKPEVWADFWRPYVAAQGPAVLPGLEPTVASLHKLRADANTLVAIGMGA